MAETITFLSLANIAAAISTFENSILAVLAAFSVVVGVALTRFFQEPRVVDAQTFDGDNDFSRELFYWSVLTALITLAIRFLVGSRVHLYMTYVPKPDTPQIVSLEVLLRFLKDMFFLFAFGAFLVRAALSRTVYGYTLWLTWFSGFGVIWSGIEYFGYQDHMGLPWLVINGIQFVVTFVCWLLAPSKMAAPNPPPTPEKEKKDGTDPNVQKSNTRCRLILVVVLMAVFVVLFCVDLWLIIARSSG